MAGFRRAPVLMAAFSGGGIHKWLPGKPQRKDYEAFRSVMDKANISKIVFLRHGQTAPSLTGIDFDRLLTDKGREQAKEAGMKFGVELAPFCTEMLVSPAPRTMETAEIFIKASGQHSVKLKPVQSLYDGTMQPKGSVLFKKFGYAPLQQYLDNTSNEQERQDAQNVLGAYAHSVLDIMMDHADSQQPSDDSCTLWMVGHAIYLPAAALGVASVAECDGAEMILSSITQEAEGYLINLDAGSVTYLER